MKKKRTSTPVPIGVLSKLWKIMRLSVFFLLLFVAQAFATVGYSQQTRLTLKMQSSRLIDVLNKIEDQSEFYFLFNQKLVDVDRSVSLDVKNESIDKILTKLFENTNVSYLVKDRQIVLTTANSESETVQQQKSITGIVTDSSGGSLPGVSVVVKGTTKGTITDVDGKYTLEYVPANAVLQFSFVGMKTKEINVGNRTSINVILEEEAVGLDELVVVGYGTQSRAKVTGSISRIEATKIGDISVPSFDQAIAGRLPGVDISQTSGAPGSSINIKIRGNSSINFGGQPLIVVDGLPLSNSSYDGSMQGQSTISTFNNSYKINPLASINPADIASIDVLKDAASAAIYGSRGSSGVIIITTNKGKSGAPQVNLNLSTGFQVLDRKVDVMDAYEIAKFTKKARDLAYVASGGNINDPLSMRKNVNYKYPTYMIPYMEGQQGLTNTDWQDAIYRTAYQQNYGVSVRGGNDDLQYYISGNYMDQAGIIINSGVKRYSNRVNLNANLTKRIKIGINLNSSITDNDMVQSEGAWSKEGIVITALMYHPNLPEYNEDGSIQIDKMMAETRTNANVANIQNPVALATYVDNKLKNKSFTGNTFLEFTPVEGLKLKTALGVESMGLHRTIYRPKFMSYSSEPAPTSNFNFALDSRASIFNWISETNATYDLNIKQHSFNFLGNFSAQKEQNSVSLLEGRNFANDNVRTINGASVTSGSTFDTEATIMSFLGRVMYSYGNKYMLSASLRRDGSSKFAPDHKWGWFPSVSGGWNIGQENFFPKNSIASNLKIRTSYGTTGNASIPFYGGIPVLSSKDYIFGGAKALGFTPGNAPNNDLSWESTSTLNLGLDVGLIRNMFQLSVDAYKSITKDLLLNVTIPATAGLTTALQNVGKIQNKGFEVVLSTRQNITKKLVFDGTIVASVNRNKVLALAPGQEKILFSSGLADPSFIVKVGEPIGSFYGYRVEGIFKTQEQFDNTPHLMGANQGVGDFIYANTNNDDKVNEDDRIILGNANPKFTWGYNSTLTWEMIDFGFSIQGKHGQQVFNAMHRYLAEAWGNNLRYWGSEDAPRPVWAYGTRSHTRPSSLHVEDASFVRIQNISLGYTLKKTLGFQKIRIYASATNPFTFTKYSGYNPEVSNTGANAITAGEDFGNYPTAKSFVLGLNVAF